MSKLEKILMLILSGSSDNNISFNEFKSILEKLGLEFRIKGSHHIYTKNDIEEIINIQPIGSKTKAYQVKQVRNII